MPRPSEDLLKIYLGERTGQHVLAGQTTRGEGEKIHAVIWLCDLRNSTRLSETVPVEIFFRTLNEFFDCTAGAVLDHGGEVLSYIGDAVFAVFVRRFALVGDAAVGMHPVTAHGYNLGLSGAEILAREITRAADSRVDIGHQRVLERYQRKHVRTTRPMYHGTNEIVKFFTDDRAPVKLARKLVLRFSNNFPPIRRAIRDKLTDAGNGLMRKIQSRPN